MNPQTSQSYPWSGSRTFLVHRTFCQFFSLVVTTLVEFTILFRECHDLNTVASDLSIFLPRKLSYWCQSCCCQSSTTFLAAASMSELLLMLPCQSCWYFLASNRALRAEMRVVTGRSSKQSESRGEYANLQKEKLHFVHFILYFWFLDEIIFIYIYMVQIQSKHYWGEGGKVM